MKFNKFLKITSISLFVVASIAILLYIGYASSKDCLGCDLPMCEGVTESGEKYLMPADSCALSYEEIKLREQEINEINAAMGILDSAEISECSKECLNYAGALMMFLIISVIIAAILVFAFAIYSIVVNRNNMKGALIGGAGVGLVILISYLKASDVVPNIIGYTNVITPAEARWVDTSLYMIYILLVAAILGIVATGVYKLIQNNK